MLKQKRTRLTPFAKLLFTLILVGVFYIVYSFSTGTTESFYDTDKVSVGECVSWKDHIYKVVSVNTGFFTDKITIEAKNDSRAYTVNMKSVIRTACRGDE
jgi:hypothetical protein